VSSSDRRRVDVDAFVSGRPGLPLSVRLQVCPRSSRAFRTTCAHSSAPQESETFKYYKARVLRIR
jgi:hypothetical protein